MKSDDVLSNCLTAPGNQQRRRPGIAGALVGFFLIKGKPIRSLAISWPLALLGSRRFLLTVYKTTIFSLNFGVA